MVAAVQPEQREREASPAPQLEGLFGGAGAPQREPATDLESRIASGEFTDSGSTKEKLTRPLRKALAQDPTGLGELAATRPHRKKRWALTPSHTRQKAGRARSCAQRAAGGQQMRCS